MVLISCFLSGCASENQALNQAMELRKAVLEANSCSFLAVTTADYGEEIYTFQMECVADSTNSLRFTVTDPESISGITGEISKESTALTFDDTVLAFPPLADGEIMPVSGPWLFINSLCSGYLTGCSSEEEGICIYNYDRYQENALHLQIYTNADFVPERAEIIYGDRRVLSMDIRNFVLQ